MFIVTGLRHNRFKVVDVPSPSKLYQKLGFGKGTEKSSGEEFINPAESKVEMARKVQKEVDKASAEAEKALKESKE